MRDAKILHRNRGNLTFHRTGHCVHYYWPYHRKLPIYYGCTWR